MQLRQDNKSGAGHYRKQSVKVGNLIPAPSTLIPKLMAELENYINLRDEEQPTLIKAGLLMSSLNSIQDFIKWGFVDPETQLKRGKLFKFSPYIKALEQDLE